MADDDKSQETEQDIENADEEDNEDDELFGPPQIPPFPFIHAQSTKPPGKGRWYSDIEVRDHHLRPYRLIKRTPPPATIRWIRRLFCMDKGGITMQHRIVAILNFAHSWPRALEVAREKDIEATKKARSKFNNKVRREKRRDETPAQKSARRAQRNAKDRARRQRKRWAWTKALTIGADPDDKDEGPDEPDVEGMDPRGAPGAGSGGGAGGSGGAAIPVGA